MNRYLIWLRTEYKRAAVMLPSVFIKAVIAAIAVGIFSFCTIRLTTQDTENTLVRIGYSAPDDKMTELAVSYVENMASVKSWCTLVPMDEATGLHALEQGDIAAFLVLPQHVIDGILTGNNQSGKLYLSSDQVFLGQLFKELATADIGLLQTAQAQIYATHMLVQELSWDTSILEKMYQEIDEFNLKIAMNREQLFHTRTLSMTENLSLAVYYGGAVLGAYMLFLGILWGKCLKRSGEEIRICEYRLGVPIWQQLVGRTGITCLMLAVSFLPVMALWLVPTIRQALKISISTSVLLLLVLSFLSMAIWLQLISLLGGNDQIITWILVLTAILSGYFSGYVIPNSLLPDVVKKTAVFLPATYVKQAFSGLFSGTVEDFLRGFLMLILWITVLTSIYLIVSCRVIPGRANANGKLKSGIDFHGTLPYVKKRLGIIVILAKRLFCKNSFLICLLFTVLLSCLAVKLERRSETTIYAGIYSEDVECRKLFTDQDGLVKFVIYDKEEELERNVRKGYLECGYVLQEGLQNDIMDGNGSWSIKVYEKPDSTMTLMVNDVLFERVFYDITSKWYEGFIANHSYFETIKREMGESQLKEKAAQALSVKLHDGSTFSIMVQGPDGGYEMEQKERNIATYPVWWVMICNLLFCGWLGIRENVEDRRRGRFPKSDTSFISRIIMMLPLCFAAMVNCIIILLIQ